MVAWLGLSAYQAGLFHFDFHRGSGHPAIDRIIKAESSPNHSLSLVVEPDDGIAPVVAMIDGAKKSVAMTMYSLNDKNVEASLARAVRRGVAVRVILNGGYQGLEPPSKKSAATFARLQAAGIPVRWSQSYFDLTHQKTLVVDGAEALVMSGNLDRTYYKKDRDFYVSDGDAKDVAAIESAFASDWEGEHVAAPDGDDLVWSPGSEGELEALIGRAKKTLLVDNEEMDDAGIENALEEAARRGVNVEVLMTMDTGWLSAFSALSAAGVHIRTFGPKDALYIHAKIIVADGALAFLGSENFSDGSLDANRELGLLFSQKDVLDRLIAVFRADWQKAQDFT